MLKFVLWVCVAVLIFAALSSFLAAILPYVLVIIGALAIYFAGFYLIKYVKNRRIK